MSARQAVSSESRGGILRRSIALSSVIVISSGVIPAVDASAQTLGNLSGFNGSPSFDLGSLPTIGDLLDTRHEQTQRELTVTPAADLTDGKTVKVTGKGYPANESIYLAQTIDKPKSGYPTTYGEAAKVTVAADGSFTKELKVSTNFGDVDCTLAQCYIASFTAFPKLNDRSNDKWTPITFADDGATNATTNAGDGNVGNSHTAAASTALNQSSTSQAQSGASVILSKTANLNPSGDTIHVDGRGFKTSGQGIYIGIAQNDQMDVTNADSFGPDTQYVSTSRGNLTSDGSFSIDLPVSATFGSADCINNACSIYTIAAHGSQDRSQDTATPVSFAGGVAGQKVELPSGRSDSVGEPSFSTGLSNTPQSLANSSASPSVSLGDAKVASPGSLAGAPSVNLSTTTLAPLGTTSITVTGSGFKTTGNGIYVAVAEKGKFSTTDAEAFSAAVYVRTSEMTPNGSFSTTLQVEPITEAANCIEHTCALYTLAAHGSPDRSQDTETDLTVGGTAKEREEAKKAGAAAAKKLSQAHGKASGVGSPVGLGNADAQTVQTASNSPLRTVATASLGAVIGALIFGAGLLIGRRKSNQSAEN